MKSINCKKLIVVLFILSLLIIPNQFVLGQSSGSAQVGVFDPITINPSSRLEVPIQIKNVNGLYALDITMKFDPTILAAEDADPAKPGIQIALGNFLDPGLVLYNTVDNQSGTVHFVMTEFNPSEPKTGSGILLVVYFKGLKSGETNLSFTNVQLSDRNGIQIPSTNVESIVKVDASIPTVVSTSIPVQESTKMVQIPTEMPTATPTVIPTSTPIPTVISAGQKSAAGTNPQATQGIAVTGGNGQTSLLQAAELFLFQNWWIVLILLLLVIIAGVYFAVTQKNQK